MSLIHKVPADDPEEIARMADMLPRISDRSTFERDLTGVSHWLALELHDRSLRVSRPELKADYEELARAYNSLKAAEENVSVLRRHLLQRVFHRAARRSMGTKLSRGSSSQKRGKVKANIREGAAKFRAAKDALADLMNWIGEAATDVPYYENPPPDADLPAPGDPNFIGPVYNEPAFDEFDFSKFGSPGKRDGLGRPRNIEIYVATRALIDLWVEQTGELPTIRTERVTSKRGGPFLDFAYAALAPIYRANGLPTPSIADVARRLLTSLK